MKIHAGLSVAEMAAIVSEALTSEGMQAVLSGGSVVTIYASNEWECRDLDFVVDRVDRKRIAATLEGFGFQQESVRRRRRYAHCDVHSRSANEISDVVLHFRECDALRICIM